MEMKESCYYKWKGVLSIHRYMLSLFLIGIPFLFLFGCGSDRVNIEFQSSRDIYIDDTKTDPDKLNRELDYDLKETEKHRLQKQRAAEAEAKAKAEAKRKEETLQGGQKTDAERQTNEATEAE